MKKFLGFLMLFFCFTGMSMSTLAAHAEETFSSVVTSEKTYETKSAGNTVEISKRENTSEGIKLQWNEVKGATGYRIYRKKYEEISWGNAIIEIKGNKTFEWIDTNVADGTIYSYAVQVLTGTAEDLSGCSAAGQAILRLEPPCICGIETLDELSFRCSWKLSEFADGYEIRYVNKGVITASGSSLGVESITASGGSLGVKTVTASGSSSDFKTTTVSGSSLGSSTVTGLTPENYYEVSVRGYKFVSGIGKFYSDWADAEKIIMRKNVVTFQGHQYQFVSALDYPTWEEMNAYCESVGGYLATILSAEENDFLYNAMHSMGYLDAYFGLTDREEEGVWNWVTGEEGTYARWYTEAVDNYQNEDYGMFWRKIAGPYWNDGALRNLDEKVAFICEWGTRTAVPSPTPTATPTPLPERAAVDEVLDLKPEDFTYKSVSGYYSCTGLSKSGYEKFSKYLSKDTVTINLPSVSDTGKKVRGFYSDSPSGYDLTVLMSADSPYIRLVCPETYVIYRGETGPATDKVIQVELNEGMKTLYKGAFQNYTGLTRMVLPESIKTYRAEVFKGCSNLVIETLVTDGVTMGSAVFEDVTINNVYIGEKFDATSETIGTFYKANIKAINFEQGVKKIPDDAFRQCYTLTEIIIPDTVTKIGTRAFKQCSSLVDVEFPTDPDKVELGKEAFYGCYMLKKATLPDNIKVIGESAFHGCVSLEVEYFDTSEKTVNGSAFYGVTINEILIAESFSAADIAVSKSSKGALEGAMVEKIIFETGISKIPDNAFRGYTGISEILIPDTVTYIDNYAFYLCSSLESVVLPDSVKEIGIGAFYGCEKLSNITLNQVTTFWDEAFKNCKKLVIETLDTSEMSIMSSALSGVTVKELLIANGFTGAYQGTGSSGKGSFEGTVIQKIVFEEGILTIGDDVFKNCGTITRIEIPSTVISIGERAFESCTKLKTIELPKSVKIIGRNAFKNCSALTTVNYPEEMVISEGAFDGCKKVKLVPYEVR